MDQQSRLRGGLLPLFLMTFALAACTASPASNSQLGQPLALTGELVLKGAGPFPQPVLETAKGEWLLDGVGPDTAMSLQNKTVDVHGTVLRLPQPGQAGLQEIEVDRIYPH